MLGRDMKSYRACDSFSGIGRRGDGLCEHCLWPAGAHQVSKATIVCIFAVGYVLTHVIVWAAARWI